MKKLLTALLITASATAMASDAEIKSKLQALGAKNIEVKDSPVKGLKTAVTDQGILYVSENGQYVLQGKMYELTNKGPVDVAGKFLADKVNALKSEMIIYPAKNEKYVVTVFMDITCHYCHILHQQLKEYNDLGIQLGVQGTPSIVTSTGELIGGYLKPKDLLAALKESAQ